MAFRKTLAHHIFHFSNITSPTLNRTLTKSIFSYPSLQILIPPNPYQTTFNREFLTTTTTTTTDAAGNRCFVRNLMTQSVSPSTLPFGDKLIEKLKSMNVINDRIRLDGLTPPPPPPPQPEIVMDQITVKDAKKLLKVAQLEMLKSSLRQIPRKSVSYSEFVRMCIEGCSNNSDQGLEFVKMLDESGSVIVLGNVVYLHPEEVTKAIGGLIPLPIMHPNDPRKKEFEMMEKEKAVIDNKAVALVRRELWAGLGFLVAQTIGFMRLTFWELSWDVMEPICFYVTSGYFMAGYAFFLRTSKEPSFEGFFESRFVSKQRQLMKKKKFDIDRFNELKRSYDPCTVTSSEPTSSIEHAQSTLIGALNH